MRASPPEVGTRGLPVEVIRTELARLSMQPPVPCQPSHMVLEKFATRREPRYLRPRRRDLAIKTIPAIVPTHWALRRLGG